MKIGTRSLAYIIEDKNSSFYFFRNYFQNINIVSAKGKDNIQYKTVEVLHNNTNKCIAVAIDACAFGLRYEQLSYILSHNPNISLIAWECFEEYEFLKPTISFI